MTRLIPDLVAKGSFRRAGPVFVALLGLAIAAGLVSCGPLNPSKPSEAAPEDLAKDPEVYAVRQPPSALFRKFETRQDSPLTMQQYRQADDYMHSFAPIDIGVPTLLFARYAQTEHMPILKRGENAESSTRRFEHWGFISFIGDFIAHIRILEGRHAEAAQPGSPFIEAVMMTEKLDALGAQVGDFVTLIHRTPNGSLEPIEVKIVGRWTPKDPDEDFWFYDPQYFTESIIVAEGTYTKVVFTGWEGIGYEYTWYMVFAESRIDSERVDAGVEQVLSNLAGMIGDVEVRVWLPELTNGKVQSTTQ